MNAISDQYNAGNPAITRPNATRSRLWLWLTVPPLVAVLGCAATIYLALKYPDPVIKAPVGTLGKAPLVDNSGAQRALDLGLSAHLTRRTDGQVQLQLDGGDHPQSLELLWIHPTRAALDRGAILTVNVSVADIESPAHAASTTMYQGVLPEPPASHGQWLLRDSAQQWRIEAQAEQAFGEFELRPVLR